MIHSVKGQNSELDSLINVLAHEDDNLKRGELYLDLATYYEYSDLIRSYDYILKVREIADKYNIEQLHSKTKLFISNLLIKQGKYNEALTHLNKELSQLKEQEAGFKYVGLLINIGAIYYQIKQFDKALKHFHKAKELFDAGAVKEQEVQYPQIFIGIYNNLANVYDELNDNPQALVYYHEALDVAVTYKIYESIGVISKNIGDLYIEMGRHADALPFIKKSVQIREQINDNSGLATSYFLLGLYYFEVDQEDRALDAYKTSLKFGIKANAWLSITETAKALSMYYKSKDIYNKAYGYFELYHQYNDSLLIQNSEKQRQATEFDFKLQQRQKEWDETLKKERYLSILIGVGLLVVAAFLLLLFSLSKARERRIGLEKKNLKLLNANLEHDLHLKRKELTTNVMYLVRKNELIKEVANRLMDTLGNFKPENQKLIQSIMVELQQSLDNDIWEEFELRFNQVHSDFYDRLREQFANLTPNEVKLSAFLRLNMSSKEISAITHQSIRSIEVARTRLRKKLALTNTEVGLVAFLNKF
ncbi:tetratricopeptide repeat protein [Carboxylicivirga sediminis]|uniref:Tetratricopeptide repeat protein n=1 Tax=Carboxylicivirga sediminis TaxID=2006564 RepID=A0A941F4M6_9BACT|nr:tetratricopeptide repeat protein [Carboxylicivirga sediminis]MBR8535615.1 tetratricopeptide repeat protein [Carboxylicivirga sediminis]